MFLDLLSRIKYSNDTLGQHRNLSWGKTSFKLLGINFDVDLDKIVNINYERILQIKKKLRYGQKGILLSYLCLSKINV
jgi:hypothetical protein